jgi:hypothetical protein
MPLFLGGVFSLSNHLLSDAIVYQVSTSLSQGIGYERLHDDEWATFTAASHAAWAQSAQDGTSLDLFAATAVATTSTTADLMSILNTKRKEPQLTGGLVGLSGVMDGLAHLQPVSVFDRISYDQVHVVFDALALSLPQGLASKLSY